MAYKVTTSLAGGPLFGVRNFDTVGELAKFLLHVGSELEVTEITNPNEDVVEIFQSSGLSLTLNIIECGD